MIVLDTNVVSEMMRPKPDDTVVAWLNDQMANDLYVCAPVLAEVHYGIVRMKDSKRKTTLLDLAQKMIRLFEGRILSFDGPAAESYGSLVASREKIGKPISVMDALIAAIAKSNRAALATRNVGHFQGIGLTLINPFGPD
ncbi:MAG: type II toxin-antitoxin system VapC family toxin [Methyloceanibacter sp.]|uniref:type II toxin-antitoxin system VapC family toxin n=1 Tax=Methyloceanibacter sp. TaxID=1965321 RepID=UPI003D6D381C